MFVAIFLYMIYQVRELGKILPRGTEWRDTLAQECTRQVALYVLDQGRIGWELLLHLHKLEFIA